MRLIGHEHEDEQRLSRLEEDLVACKDRLDVDRHLIGDSKSGFINDLITGYCYVRAGVCIS